MTERYTVSLTFLCLAALSLATVWAFKPPWVCNRLLEFHSNCLMLKFCDLKQRPLGQLLRVSPRFTRETTLVCQSMDRYFFSYSTILSLLSGWHYSIFKGCGYSRFSWYNHNSCWSEHNWRRWICRVNLPGGPTFSRGLFLLKSQIPFKRPVSL